MADPLKEVRRRRARVFLQQVPVITYGNGIAVIEALGHRVIEPASLLLQAVRECSGQALPLKFRGGGNLKLRFTD